MIRASSSPKLLDELGLCALTRAEILASNQKYIQALRDRSAQIVGMMIGSIPQAFPEVYMRTEEDMPIEGSVFWQIPKYCEKVGRQSK
ncbi:MAG TPA: hypothetical protein VG935_00855 [Patescibacteria group bacterium]|nr:hypothetical protein [Patescibacteria group bacterium]